MKSVHGVANGSTAMAQRKMPIFSVQVSKSVQFTFVTLAGVSAGYLLWKWLGEGEGEARKRLKKKRTVPGLLNVGNTCFMNALLQAFASCPSFVKWIEEFTQETESDKDHVYLATVVQKLLKILTGDEELHEYYFDPSELLQDMGGRGWQISSQEQDAHEFYHAVMTTLVEEYRHHVDKSRKMFELFEVKELLSSPIQLRLPVVKEEKTKPVESHDLACASTKLSQPCFRGTLACVLRCQTCGYQNPVRYDGFDSLSLPLPPSLSWMSQISVVDCLRSFTASELVTNVECINCSRLKGSGIDESHEETKNHIQVKSEITDAISNAVEDLSSTGVAETALTDETDVIHETAIAHETAKPRSQPSGEEIKAAAVAFGKTKLQSSDELTAHCDTIFYETSAAGEPKLMSSSQDIINSDVTDFSCCTNAKHLEGDPAEANDSTTLKQSDGQMSACKKFIKSPAKQPFPKLILATQRESFEKHFRRGVYRESKSRTDYLFPSAKRTFQRRLCLGKLPDCLCIHLQRLVWMKGTPIKKMNFIHFPEIMDVGPYTEIARIKGKSPKNGDSFSESIKNLTPSQMQKVLVMRRSALNGDIPEVGVAKTPPLGLQGGSEKSYQISKATTSSSNQALYRLMSVIVHVGDWSFSGHFLAYRRSPDSKNHEEKSEWIFTSDTMVRKATREEVFSCPAYMLFYERIKP